MPLPVCPYCASSDTRRDYSCGGDEVLRCPACDLLFCGSRGDQQRWNDYYRRRYSEDFGQEQEGRDREVIYGDALDAIERLAPKGPLFDIGAGSGTLLAMARSRGWTVSGQEISSGGCRLARERHGLELVQADVAGLKLDSDAYHAITMVNILDHLVTPWPVLDCAHRALRRGGVLYIRVPNGGLHRFGLRLSMTLPGPLLRDGARKLFVLHRYHLTPDFLRRALGRAGFGSVIVRPAVPSRGVPYLRLRQGERRAILALKRLIPPVAGAAYGISGGRLVLSPSMSICGVKD